MENVGILLEALAYDTNKSIIPEYKEVLLKTKYARDNESEDMIDIVIDSVSFEFGLNAWQDTVANPLRQEYFRSEKPLRRLHSRENADVCRHADREARRKA